MNLSIDKNPLGNEIAFDLDFVGQDRRWSCDHDGMLSELLGMEGGGPALQDKAVQVKKHTKTVHSSVQLALDSYRQSV
jgi:hypothetical protein